MGSAIENDVFRRYAGFQSRLLNTLQDLQLRDARLRLIPTAMTTLNEVAILLIGFLLVIKGQLTLGMLLAAQTIALSLKSTIEEVIGFFQDLPSFEAGVLRLEDVLEQPRDPLLASGVSKGTQAGLTRLSGSFEINDLRFGFSPFQPPLFDGFSLSVQPGMRIALVGGSGSGKSTLARLIAGLIQPLEGDIRFDNIKLLDVPRDVMVNSLAMVQQDIDLYGCSVRDNLRLWNTTIPDTDLLQACRDAEILDVIKALPEGFDTMLSEGGRNLSGGQRQRLELARALIQNPSILILDEATSALDAQTEQRVIANLNLRGCTQVIVAHRLSTIRDADLILVMEQGRVVQRGKHDAMIADKDSPYAQLLAEVR